MGRCNSEHTFIRAYMQEREDTKTYSVRTYGNKEKHQYKCSQIKENHPMKPMGDATLNSNNSRSIRSYAPIFGSIVSRYVLSDNAQVHLPIR